MKPNKLGYLGRCLLGGALALGVNGCIENTPANIHRMHVLGDVGMQYHMAQERNNAIRESGGDVVVNVYESSPNQSKYFKKTRGRGPDKIIFEGGIEYSGEIIEETPTLLRIMCEGKKITLSKKNIIDYQDN